MRRRFHLGVRRRDLVEKELDEEIRAHLAMRAERLVARGLTRHDAEAEALRRFGPLDAARAELLDAARSRDGRLTMLERLDGVRQDLRATFHQIRRAPLFAAAIVATFALGIGANATMFGIVDRLLLRAPAHVVAPEQLVRIETRFKMRGEDATNTGFSYPQYTDLRDHVPAFANVAMHTYPTPVSLGVGADARKVQAMLVSGTYFPTLGVRAAIGRALTPDDDRLPDGSPVVVIGDALWRKTFGADPRVIGKSMVLAKNTYTVVGVAPRGFVGEGGRLVDAWIPVSAGDGIRFAPSGGVWATSRNNIWMSIVARVRPGQNVAVATAQAQAAIDAGDRTEPTFKPDLSMRVMLASVLPERQAKLTPERRVAALLGAISAFVLLIAAANVANLLLVRSAQRRREVALRVALGVPRGRLVRQLVAESLTLALLGGVAALAVVRWGSLFVQRVLLSDFAWPESPIDARMVAFTLLAATIVGVLAGAAPALHGSAPDLSGMLKDGSRGAGVARSRTRTGLLLVQAALSTVLLVGTGLFLRSVRNAHGVDLGLDVERLVVGVMDQRAAGLDSIAGRAYYDDVAQRASRLPGVAGVSVADASPFTDWQFGADIDVPGVDSARLAKMNGPNKAIVSSDYFKTVGTRVVRGRAFGAADTRPGAAPVMLVNETAARLLWPNENALGKCIHTPFVRGTPGHPASARDAPCSEIIGIVRDTHRSAIANEDPHYLQLYLPTGQADALMARVMLVRAAPGVDPDALVEPVRRLMQSTRPNLPYANVRAMRSALDGELQPWRLGATMFSAFGAIALVLSALGLYGVVTHTVTQRTHEMGVRLALGARRGDIVRLVLGTGFRVAVAGIALGTVAALAAGRLVEPMLFHVSPRDPFVFVSVAATLVLVAALASLAPARRASRADPLSSLRTD